MKIVHLTSVHPRNDTRVFLKECRSLASAGYNVTLVVADGKGAERRDGVNIVDVGKPKSRLNRMLGTVNKICRVAASLDADVYHLHDPELLRVALRLKEPCGRDVKVLYDAHEDYAEQIKLKPYLPQPLSSVISSIFAHFERYIVGRIDGVIVVMDRQADAFRKQVKRCAVVPNYADLRRFIRREVNFRWARILHAGSLSEARGLGQMIKLADLMGTRGEVVLAGPVDSSASPIGFGRARYLGVLDETHLLDEYMRSNIGLILYQPVGQYGNATSIKVYEYMAASMPVIVPDHGDWPEFVRKVGCGLAVNVDNVEQQIAAVDFLLSNPARARAMGLNGREYALSHASWEMAFSSMLQLYRDF